MQDPIRTHERKLVGVEFVDDDGGKHLVFRSTAAFDNAPNSNFVRRMTSIPRLQSAMSGEGLLLDSEVPQATCRERQTVVLWYHRGKPYLGFGI